MRAFLVAIGETGWFLLTILRASGPRRDFLPDLLAQIYSVAVRSLPIIAVGGAFVGLVLTLQGYRTLASYGATNSVSTMLGLALYRELGPVLTALLFIGRAGSSMAAELGLMKATDQIASLSLMAIDPIAKTVVPRFWAAVIGMPLLCGFFCAFAILAGYLEAVYALGLDAGFFWAGLQNSVDLYDDFVVAFVKSAVFGLLGALMATHTGFYAEPTIEGTSVATTHAVVNGSLLVLVFNFILSALFFQS